METKKVEIKDFTLHWNGCAWIIRSKIPKMTEFLYLPVTQIVEMIKIENITTKEFDRLVFNWKYIKFNKVVLLAEQYDNGDFVCALMYEPTDYNDSGFEMIQTEVKVLK